MDARIGQCGDFCAPSAEDKRIAALEPHHVLRWFENSFLDMQRQIFEDQAPAHHAYSTDGIDGIEAMFADGQIDQNMYDSWSMIHEGIETGDQSMIDAASASGSSDDGHISWTFSWDPAQSRPRLHILNDHAPALRPGLLRSSLGE